MPKALTLTAEELARVKRAKQQHQKSSVGPEWLALAEFGQLFGWEAVQEVRNNGISDEDFNMLLNGGRKVWSARLVDIASAIYVGSAAAQSKKGGQIFRKGMERHIKNAKADE